MSSLSLDIDLLRSKIAEVEEAQKRAAETAMPAYSYRHGPKIAGASAPPSGLGEWLSAVDPVAPSLEQRIAAAEREQRATRWQPPKRWAAKNAEQASAREEWLSSVKQRMSEAPDLVDRWHQKSAAADNCATTDDQGRRLSKPAHVPAREQPSRVSATAVSNFSMRVSAAEQRGVHEQGAAWATPERDQRWGDLDGAYYSWQKRSARGSSTAKAPAWAREMHLESALAVPKSTFAQVQRVSPPSPLAHSSHGEQTAKGVPQIQNLISSPRSPSLQAHSTDDQQTAKGIQQSDRQSDRQSDSVPSPRGSPSPSGRSSQRHQAPKPWQVKKQERPKTPPPEDSFDFSLFEGYGVGTVNMGPLG